MAFPNGVWERGVKELLHMTNDNKKCIPQVRFGPIQWLSNSLRASIEEAVSKYKGPEWKIRSERDLSEFACHPCAIVSDECISPNDFW